MLAALLLAPAVALTGCSKTSVKVAQDAKNPYQLIYNTLFTKNVPSDFTTLVSTTHGVSLFEPNPISQASSVVQAWEKGRTYAGLLSVNEHNIPYDNGTYLLPSGDPTTGLPATTFTGVTNSYILEGTGNIPSFSKYYYSPAITNLTYDGLIDDKLDQGTALTISWTADAGLINDRGLMLLSSSDGNGNYTELVSKVVQDKAQSVIFTAAELAGFNNADGIKVMYARGYNNIETIEGKSIEFQFMNFSWSFIVFR